MYIIIICTIISQLLLLQLDCPTTRGKCDGAKHQATPSGGHPLLQLIWTMFRLNSHTSKSTAKAD